MQLLKYKCIFLLSKKTALFSNFRNLHNISFSCVENLVDMNEWMFITAVKYTGDKQEIFDINFFSYIEICFVGTGEYLGEFS
jgi:hypothetical protein